MADNTPAGMGMRVIHSTTDLAAARDNGLSVTEVSVLVALIGEAANKGGAWRPARESYCTDSIGQKVSHAALVAYMAPDGSERWGLLVCDPNEAEYSDSTDRAVVEAAYEVVVRSLADCASPGEAWWEHTDVAGVPERDENEEED